jgi:ketosteroid isomerase-like protein
MTEENVEVIRRLMEAFEGNDLEAFLSLLDPRVEWGTQLAFRSLGIEEVYRGHAEVTRWWNEFQGQTTIDEIETLPASDDRVVVIALLRVHGERSGAEASWEQAGVFTVQDGKVIRRKSYGSPEAALEAAGLEE